MRRLIELRGGSPHADLVRDILVTGLKLIDDGASRYDLKVINAALFRKIVLGMLVLLGLNLIF